MQLSCHCGLIQIEVSSVPVQLTSCNCSVCSRYAALWGYYGPAEVNVIDDKFSGRSYLWGDECVEFFHCQECGCITHYMTTEKVDESKIGINFRMAEPDRILNLPVKKFDGANSWQYLE